MPHLSQVYWFSIAVLKKITLKHSSLKHISYLTVSVGMDDGFGFAGSSGSASHPEIKVLARVAVISGLDRLSKPLGWFGAGFSWILVACWIEASVPHWLLVRVLPPFLGLWASSGQLSMAGGFHQRARWKPEPFVN